MNQLWNPIAAFLEFFQVYEGLDFFFMETGDGVCVFFEKTWMGGGNTKIFRYEELSICGIFGINQDLSGEFVGICMILHNYL